MNLLHQNFSDINLEDIFFDSLKSDYLEFSDWFLRKAHSGESAYVFYNDVGSIDGFLYLKIEIGEINDITPPLPHAIRLKVGTFKINPHGTRLGERFIKKLFDHALHHSVDEIYVTIFSHHEALIQLFDKYGFRQVASKTTANGIETVRVRSMTRDFVDTLLSYPMLSAVNSQPYLLALHPDWHTRLLPDSILHNENANIVQDVSHTNSIHKVYLCAMPGVQNIQRNDPIVIYRMGDGQGPAEYRAVATSLCSAEEYRHISSFSSLEEFLRYCRPYSVFSEQELVDYWNTRRFPHILRFTYNIALNQRVIRKTLADEVGLNRADRWGFIMLTAHQLKQIANIGGVDEGLIVD